MSLSKAIAIHTATFIGTLEQRGVSQDVICEVAPAFVENFMRQIFEGNLTPQQVYASAESAQDG